MSETPFTPQAIYFDTNPLIAAGWPTPSAQLLQVLDQADRLDLPFCLPELVCQELEEHWIRDLTDEWQRANGQIGKVNKRARSVAKYEMLPALPSREKLQEAVRVLVADFTERFSLIPVTKRPLSEFLELAIGRAATFEEGGRGFQDAVILYSVLDDMAEMKRTEAILVSNDKAFQNSGVAELSRNLGVNLKIVQNLDELEEILRRFFSALVREYYARERQQLIDALTKQLPEIEAYLVENLTVSPRELGVWNTVRKIESLQVEGIENAHTAFALGDEKPADPNKVKVSVDVKIRLVLDIERAPLAEPQRLKIGGGVVQPSAASSSLGAMFFEFQSKFHDATAVVEADANKTEDGYSSFRFTGAYLKSKDSGFGAWARLSGGSK